MQLDLKGLGREALLLHKDPHEFYSPGSLEEFPSLYFK